MSLTLTYWSMFISLDVMNNACSYRKVKNSTVDFHNGCGFYDVASTHHMRVQLHDFYPGVSVHLAQILSYPSSFLAMYKDSGIPETKKSNPLV